MDSLFEDLKEGLEQAIEYEKTNNTNTANYQVFLKTKDDGLWEKSPHVAFALYLVIYIVMLFASLFAVNIPGWIIVIFNILLLIGLIALSLYSNNMKNLSKSTGFVKRDNVLYLVRLSYLNEPEGNIIGMPSGSAAQAVTLGHNLKVAENVQNAEKEVRDRRINPGAYVDMVEQYLNMPELNLPDKYTALPAGCEELIILLNPKIEKENKKAVWISYDSKDGRKVRKIRNAYDGLKEAITRNFI